MPGSRKKFSIQLRDQIDDTSSLDEALIEHDSVKQLIEQLEEMEPQDELFDARFTVLGEYVHYHVEEEEKEMIPQAKRAKVDLRALGGQLIARKRELQSSMATEEE